MRSIVVVLCALVAVADASAVRIDLTKANKATSPLKYSLVTSKVHGLISVRFDMQRAQKPLDHLWRVDLVVRNGNKTVVHAPLETKLDKGLLTTEMLVEAGSMQNLEIWVRTGEHAPLAETIYVVDVGSYK